MKNASRIHYLSDLGLVVAAFTWGATFIVVKDSLSSINPVLLVGYRFLIAALILGGILILKRVPLWTTFSSGAVLGILLWLLFIPQTIGLQYTTVSNSGFITGLYVVFVPLILWVVFKKIPQASRAIGIFLALCGLYLLTGGLHSINLGDILTLITAFANAAYIIAGDVFSKEGVNPYALSFQQFITVGVLSVGTALAFRLSFVTSAKTMGVILFLALIPTLFAFTTQLVAQRYTPPLRVALIFALEPVFAALFAWTVGGEPFSLMAAFGGLLIVAALVIGELPDKKRTPGKTGATEGGPPHYV